MVNASEHAQQMLETALKMEAKGQEFYTKAAATCRNPLGSAVFRKLVEDERAHVTRIERLFKTAKAGGKDWSAELGALEGGRGDLAVFFVALVDRSRERITADTTDLEALDIGIEFEANAVRFYEAELPKAQDATEQRFVRRMIAEEREHLTTLTELKRFLTDPDAWFRANEAIVADG
jgi:rubrerythrin